MSGGTVKDLAAMLREVWLSKNTAPKPQPKKKAQGVTARG